jgi:acetate kinase
MHVLALNLGSTGLKAGCFDADGDGTLRKQGGSNLASRDETASHPNRVEALLEELAQSPLMDSAPDIVAHRVVHGGDLDGPALLTDDVLASLQALSTLAPLHQAPELALASSARQRWPKCVHVAVFDTGWHRTMPDVHQRLPLPAALHERGVRRYGFHGLAFASGMARIVERWPALANGRIVLAHLGGGSSLCAIRNGRSVNTTMGMTPLAGVAMGTRPGSLDPGVVLHLQRTLGMSNEDIDHLFWRESGLRGMSGESGDMRHLLASGTSAARRAVAVYVTLVAQGVAAMAACVGGIDVLGFSGGIGQNAAPVRERICEQLGWMGIRMDPAANEANRMDASTDDAAVRTLILPIDEEREMAREAMQWMRQHSTSQPTSA